MSVTYPSVKHKLPDLFNVIIAADTHLSILKELKVIPFEKYKKYKQDRFAYTRSAENFVKRQKGGNVV